MNTHSTKEKLAKLVREAREAKGFTQVEIADKLEFDTPQFVSLMERGKSKIPFIVLGKLTRILNINEDFIVGILTDDFTANVRREMEIGKKRIK